MSSIPFDPVQVRKLASILSETGLTEIEIVDGENRIRVARAPAPVSMFAGPQTQVAPGAPAYHAPAQTALAPAETPAADDVLNHPGLIKSPMVGVAYLSPEPDSPPFVKVGQTVTAGQTLLLIEAMKTFNQLKSPKAGVVAQIIVAAGAPVEYGEPLLVIE